MSSNSWETNFTQTGINPVFFGGLFLAMDGYTCEVLVSPVSFHRTRIVNSNETLGTDIKGENKSYDFGDPLTFPLVPL